jgi:hypothetical protein
VSTVEFINSDLVHGVAAMEPFVGKPARKIYYLLSRGRIPGAFHLPGANEWSLNIAIFRAATAPESPGLPHKRQRASDQPKPIPPGRKRRRARKVAAA